MRPASLYPKQVKVENMGGACQLQAEAANQTVSKAGAAEVQTEATGI